MSLLAPAAVAFGAGVGLITQAFINARLGSALGGVYWSGGLSACVTCLLAILVGYLVIGPPKLDGLAAQPWWIWTSGLYGAVIVVGMAYAVPNLGGAATVVLVVCGQVVASLVIDHFGVFGTAIAASPLRMLGAALVAVGATLVLWVGR